MCCFQARHRPLVYFSAVWFLLPKPSGVKRLARLNKGPRGKRSPCSWLRSFYFWPAGYCFSDFTSHRDSLAIPFPFLLWLSVTDSLVWIRQSLAAASKSSHSRRWEWASGAAVMASTFAYAIGAVQNDSARSRGICMRHPSLTPSPHSSGDPRYVRRYGRGGTPARLFGYPLICKRSVLVHSHCFFPYRVHFFNEMRQRGIVSLRLLYARDVQEVADLLQSRRVDLLLVNKDFLNHPVGWSGPSNMTAQSIFDENKNFLFNDPPSSSIVASAGKYLLVDLRRIVATPAGG